MIVSVLLVAIICLGVYIASHRLDGVRLVVAFAVLGAGGLIVIAPSFASAAAAALGVGRGTDLLLYVVTLTGVFIAAHFYFRSERQARQIAVLVRELALLRGELAAHSATHLAPAASREEISR